MRKSKETTLSVQITFDSADTEICKTLTKSVQRFIGLLTDLSDFKGVTIQSSIKEGLPGHDEPASVRLVDYMKEQLENDIIAPSTKQNRETTIGWIESLFPGLTMNNLPTSFTSQLIKALQNEHLSNNTIGKHLRHLRIYLRRAQRNGLLGTEWLNTDLYHIRSIPSNHTHLSMDELEKIEISYHTKSLARMFEVQQAFLFSCYTGIRFSDIKTLTNRNFILQDKIVWLNFKTQKTSTEIHVPLNLLFNGKALHIYNKVKHRQKYLFILSDNSSVNKALYKMRLQLQIKTHFSFHSARHTFATQLLYNGVNLPIVQKLLGHHSIKTTQIYAEVTNQTLLKGLSVQAMK